MDMTAYDQYLSGDLRNYTLSDEEIEQGLSHLPKLK